MKPTFALDIYGTLINPLAIKSALAKYAGDKADTMAESWRTKQLEYSFRRGLMGTYRNFTSVTRAALDYACAFHNVEISEADKTTLMNLYRALDAFDDTALALAKLKRNGAILHAFSNGVADDIAALLKHTGIEKVISSVISADTVKTFKPDPRVYSHFMDMTKTDSKSTWLVSSNPFDLIGAGACGWNTVWVKRDKHAVFDPWEQEPTATVSNLSELATLSVIWDDDQSVHSQ